jgi:UDP:flavonoid glycosyltransferase YjiC (YdhE family)
VLLSLSTTDQAGQRAALQGVLDELAAEPVRVLVTLGGAVARADLTAPRNATLVGYVAHQTLLPHVAAVVTHAGLSTVTATLDAGLPMVCVPQGRDQPRNAARVEALGAGITTTVDGVRAGLTRVLGDARYRNAAQRLAQAGAALGSGRYAADLVEAVAVTRDGDGLVAAPGRRS